MRRTAFVLLVVSSVVVALLTASSTAAAGDTVCTGTPGEITVNGNLTVPPGALCRLEGTHVTGNVTVQQGSGGVLGVQPATDGTETIIDGNVEVQRGGSAGLTNATIGGNYHCNQCLVADLLASSVNGNFEDNGLTEGAFIIRNTIGGNLLIHDSLGGGFQFVIARNTIGGNVEFKQNDAGAMSNLFINNAIAKNFHCLGNSPPPTGFGNTAKQKQGQCAGL